MNFSSLQNHPFCRFAEQVKEQVEGALRALKNRHDLNSDLLLFCYWFAANNQGVLSKAHIKRLLATIYSWQQKIIGPLNALSDQITELTALNQLVLGDSAQESAASALFTAEQIEQLLIAEVLPKKPRRGRIFLAQTTTHACLNVSTYCQTVYVSLDETDYESLAQIMMVVFPEMDAMKIPSFIRTILSGRQIKVPLQKNLVFSS